MHRRDFLKTNAQAAVAGAAISLSRSPSTADEIALEAPTSSIWRSYSAAEHRRRLENVGYCHRAIRSCLRKHLVTDYLPAQCCYNLGEYPCLNLGIPATCDERELDRLEDHGIELIQLFEDWNDSLRLFGATSSPPSTRPGSAASLRWSIVAA